MNPVGISDTDIQNYAKMKILYEEGLNLWTVLLNPLSHIADNYESIDNFFQEAMENDARLAKIVNSYLIEARKMFEEK